MVQPDTSAMLDGARMVLAAVVAGTIGFLKERNIPIEDWVSYTGERLGNSWGGLGSEGADTAMEHLLKQQILPLGVEVAIGELTPEKAEVTVTQLPSAAILEKFGTSPRKFLKVFGVTAKEFSSIYGIFGPAARAVGLQFTYELKNGRQMLLLERTENSMTCPDSPGR